jgi:hypothetical protein
MHDPSTHPVNLGRKANLKCLLPFLACFSLAACTGISTARIVANGPAEVSVDGQFLGPAPVAFPVPWRNIDGVINYAQRKVTVTAEGKIVYEKEISSTIYQKAQTGDFKDGSQYGTGRTYTIMVDIHPATQPASSIP